MPDLDPNFPIKPHRSMESGYVRRVLVAIGLAVSAVLGILFIWQALNVLLMIFAGALFGIYLHFFKCQLSARTRLHPAFALVIVILVFLLLLTLFLMLFVPALKEQTITLFQEIPKSMEKLRYFLMRFGWGHELIQTDQIEKLFTDLDGAKVLETAQNILNIFSTTFGAAFSILFVIIIGIYMAAEMDTYFNGLVSLFPGRYRSRGTDILHRLGYILRWWLLGQSLSMLILGTTVFFGLWILNFPYALTLAIFTALMTFIPNLGPVLAFIPILLVALTKGPLILFYVFLFYVIIQTIEGMFITPMVHRKAIVVPPVLILSVQVILFQLIGLIGVILAMPLIACALVLTQMVYIEGILKEPKARKTDTPRKDTETDAACPD